MSIASIRIDSGGYQEKSSVIRDIQFELNAGELVGLIGPNGAGKSTTIKAMLGLLPHFAGEVSFNNGTGIYSYIPEQPILYDGLTLMEHIDLVTSAYDIDATEGISRIEHLLTLFRLQEVVHHYPQSFSKGMQQKVMLILSFLIEPDLYIIDEPFIGLDPVAVHDFLKLLEHERSRGAAVLMSTHVLDSAERLCDRLILMNQGTIAAMGTFKEIQNELGMPEATLFDCFYQVMKNAE